MKQRAVDLLFCVCFQKSLNKSHLNCFSFWNQGLKSVFQDFYDEQGVFSESFWPQSEPPQAMAFNPRGRVSKPLTPPPTTQSINNQVSVARHTARLHVTCPAAAACFKLVGAITRAVENCRRLLHVTWQTKEFFSFYAEAAE